MTDPRRAVVLAPRQPERVVAPAPEAPSLGELFSFMRDAELRFDTLRLRLTDRTATAAGEAVQTIEVWLRHPGWAKVVTRAGGDLPAAGGASQVWVGDGQLVRTYDARHGTASVRPVRGRVGGATDPTLPARSRVYVPRTQLPAETLADTFVHPHGFCRNLLATADPLVLEGTTRIAGREAYLVRAEHPRRAEVLTDRPDRWVLVGVDRLTGLVLLLEEHAGDRRTRHAEVTDLELDRPIGDEAFVLHLPGDVHRIY